MGLFNSKRPVIEDNHVFAPTMTPEQALAAATPFMIKKLGHHWDYFDVDGNNVVTKSDFLILEQRLAEGPNITPEKKAALHNSLDWIWTNLWRGSDTAQIPRDVFIKNVLHARSDPHVLRMEATKYNRVVAEMFFSIIDKNGNGTCTTEELSFFLSAFAVQDPASVRRSFAGLDKNDNGLITRAEFIEAFKDYFLGEDENSPSVDMWGDINKPVRKHGMKAGCLNCFT